MQSLPTRHQRRYAKMRYKRYHTHNPPSVFISPTETRSELVDRGRDIMDRIQSRSRTCLPPFTAWEIRRMLAEVAVLRGAALARPPSPQGADIAWYVSVRDGGRSALLYGPLRSQGEALRALPAVRHFVHERNYEGVAFAAWGTATITGPNPRMGSLNGVLEETLGTQFPVSRENARLTAA
jgi:hypothetical protein